jgi:hypothetical protein
MGTAASGSGILKDQDVPGAVAEVADCKPPV